MNLRALKMALTPTKGGLFFALWILAICALYTAIVIISSPYTLHIILGCLVFFWSWILLVRPAIVRYKRFKSMLENR